jgi:hypothetical protein
MRATVAIIANLATDLGGTELGYDAMSILEHCDQIAEQFNENDGCGGCTRVVGSGV